ncbi:dTDP-4-dehydrorhamnose reductase [Micromonospora pattaloongensis]|uniref:dTDP-4-dehydrorhamnose reductase n=1 Tax=Micromonospora pattaloongensis TaxID=405436 RepID=A0A1H3S5E8_9ACTN|nr:sugar nucleotide-binding protein [Micromonospora pattaloongensis]SDZ32808.1 dTDP-4-dehydrorhamnose reductase [Micromonospora pattaloongensis]
MTLLVVGASGHLGSEVCRRALAAGQRVVGTYHRAPGTVEGVEWYPLDLRDRAAVSALVGRVRPRAVVSSAYVYGDWAVTAEGAAHVAAAASEAGARLVHLSSDALHGGRAEPYPDDEPPTPIFPYGAAKAAAETAVRLVDPAAAIVRTSLILGDERSKQIRLCLDALTGAGPRLFSDEVRCPVGVDDLAAAVLELVQSDYAGPLNVGGSDAVTRVELGLLVAHRYGLDSAGLRATTIAGSGLIRPAEVRLDSSRAAAVLKTRLRGVRELLAPPG